MLAPISGATAPQIAAAGGDADAVAQAALDDANVADIALSGDRFVADTVMQDSLAQTARDQLGERSGKAGQDALSRRHVFSQSRHERAAWHTVAAAEHQSHLLHRKARHAQEAARAEHRTIRHHFAGSGVRLNTTPEQSAAIAAGEHQIPLVDGTALTYPSQNLAMIESTTPGVHGQTHGLTRHVGKSLDDNVARLRAEPHIRAAGAYFSAQSAQDATDRTIANPANQQFIADFLADPGRTKAALRRVDLGADVGASTTRRDLDARHPTLIGSRAATVVLIKDPSFPEGYRTLTTYPDVGRPAEVDRQGAALR